MGVPSAKSLLVLFGLIDQNRPFLWFCTSGFTSHRTNFSLLCCFYPGTDQRPAIEMESELFGESTRGKFEPQWGEHCIFCKMYPTFLVGFLCSFGVSQKEISFLTEVGGTM